MNKTLLILSMLSAGLTSCDGYLEMIPCERFKFTDSIDSPGMGYMHAKEASISAVIILAGEESNQDSVACMWPESYPGSDEPGAAYIESQAAAEDIDCLEEK